VSLHRRPVGRGRILAGLSALVLIVGCIPPWWTAGSAAQGLPQISGNAFDGPSIAVFLVALATLALITLPYASDRPVSFDRWWAYAALAIVGWIGLGLRVIDLALTPGGIGTMTPDRAPGLWITVVGLALLSRAAYQISREPEYR
jgi:hypothetical protein